MSNLSTPPIADPGSPVGDYAAPTPQDTLSKNLMFLQEILLEYELTNPDWRSSDADVALMADLRAKMAAAEATLTSPTLTETESMWLQEILIEYEHRNLDWRNRLSDFNEMLAVTALVSSEVPGQPIPAQPVTTVPVVAASSSGGLNTPPTADPDSGV
jgi:hypothetical protein